MILQQPVDKDSLYCLPTYKSNDVRYKAPPAVIKLEIKGSVDWQLNDISSLLVVDDDAARPRNARQLHHL